ncbi:Arm DNA-binding domain-containing protein [Yoonia sp.]|uniref:Arm DNA-binding domain-containing protein n=1 Tax=Yoonia sp. TaxID=2212373 RepID=UPI004047D3B9
MTLATDLAIRRWKPTKDGEAVGTGGRTGLYVRGWKTGTKAFYFRAKTWIKLGDYPDTTLAMARELSTVAKRLAREGFGVEALSRGFANGIHSKRGACITDNAPHNAINQMSQTLSWFKPPLVPKTLTTDTHVPHNGIAHTTLHLVQRTTGAHAAWS